MSRMGQLMKRFRLSPKATQAELRAAYLKEAKVLHPDVAGKHSEDQFRRLKEEYEEAMELLRKGSSSVTTTSAPRRPASYAYAHWQQQARPPPRPPQPPPSEPLTPAQRIRNVVLAAGGVMAVVTYSIAPTTSPQRNFASQPSAPNVRMASATSPASQEDGGVGETAGAPLVTRPSRGKPPGYTPIPEYYKTRTSKSTVRVRGGDAYVSPAEAPKSRSSEEGLGLSFTLVGALARGDSPSEAKAATPGSSHAAAAPSLAPAGAAAAATTTAVSAAAPPSAAPQVVNLVEGAPASASAVPARDSTAA